MDSNFDYVIIGAGSTGVHLAAELADRGYAVAVLDKSTQNHIPFYLKIPLFASFLLDNEKWANHYQSLVDVNLGNRTSTFFSSNLLGGLAEMNGAVCFAGHKDLYKKAFASLRSERESFVNSIYNISTLATNKIYQERKRAWDTPLSNKFLQFWGEHTGNINVDFDKELIGSGWLMNNRKRYLRFTAVNRFKKYIESGKIKYFSDQKVNSLCVKNDRVVGLKFEEGGYLNISSAKIVLSAGAIGSAEILLRSGIGDAEELESIGIAPVMNLPGVGRHLVDHPNFRIPFYSHKFSSSSLSNSFATKVIELIKYLILGKGFYGSTGASCAANIRSTSRNGVSDLIRIQLVHFALAMTDDRSKFDLDPINNFSLSVSLVSPNSRGYVRILANGMLSVNAGHLSDGRDMEKLIDGFFEAVKFIRHITGETPLSDLFNKGRDAVAGYLLNNVNTGYHIVGTCSIGDDYSKHVCNKDLSVKGFKNLFVCDASVFPSHVSTNTYFPCLMLADYFVANSCEEGGRKGEVQH